MRRVAAFIAIGAALTLLFSYAERVDATRERNLLFDGAEERVRRSIRAELEDELFDFRSTIRFIEATHPGPIAEYQAFVDVDVEPGSDRQAGAVLLERIPRREVAVLENRERALGNDGFSVVLTPVSGTHRLIVTRAGSSQRLLGLPSMGLDLTESVDRLFPDGLAEDDVELHLVPSNRLLNMVRFVREEQTDDHTVVLIAPVREDDGELIGHSLVFRSMALLLEQVEPDLVPGLGVEVRWDGDVAGRRGATGAAVLESVEQLATAGEGMEIRVFGDDQFGPPTGLSDQWRIFVAGSLLTLLAVLLQHGRTRSRRRLAQTQFELARAQSMAFSDPLTGLLNRAGFLDAARRAGDRSPSAVFFIDLDGFKGVNDALGHEEGDRLLRRVADVLLDVVRNGDPLCRYGGDEFVGYMSTDDASMVEVVARRMIEAVERAELKVTCSIGVTIRPAGRSVDVKEMIREADAAMYAAKVAGGGCYVVTDRSTESTPAGRAGGGGVEIVSGHGAD